MFDSVLIANRGEIAVRIARTAHRLGMRVIAVYSEADAGAPHVRAADEAVAIGPAPASESYLVIDKIIAAATETGAACIHPGYGFLAENAVFADACDAVGIVFVGPPAEAIRAMGHKDAAKALMETAGVPVVPGYHGERQGAEFLKQKAYETGYPVLIKAVAGGGGKGMRRVDKVLDFDEALAAAKREAENAFGDGRVLIEKFVADPRHIEVQVFADSAGNAIHLYERDCSLQRRHQKVMEEAPAPGMTPEVRAAMGEAAVTAAKAVGYRGAGTVEFIADGSKGLRQERFWFMEMNTRLQVEHPVTEAITGTDLVEWQFRVAAGQKLPMTQEEVPLSGHAVEVRLYAEDPDTGFLPSSGRLDLLRLAEAEGVRVDAGVEEGGSVSPHYDPMIAKLIAHGETRDQAFDRLGEALSKSVVAGPKSNLAFLRAVVDHPEVRKGGFDTGFCDREIARLTGGTVGDAAIARAVERLAAPAAPTGSGWADPWAASDGFQLGGVRDIVQPILVGGEAAEARLVWDAAGFSARYGAATSRDGGAAEIAGPGVAYALDGGRALRIELEDPLSRLAEDFGDAGHIRAPMHGKVIAVFVASGDTVSRGDRLFAVEAMKMEHVVTAPHDGTVAAVAAVAGDQVEEGGEVVTLAIPELEAAD
ncbi:3-methylcrotonyl-CoA carboxylase alpha subunit [Rhodobium orientis]|uniref:Carbamoyl-phosphate synthase subunit L n=1 Tax=Rhodobium orientis TaxID=34017 RepID=A0A327JN33_9HYPH|nr:biotin carboxylase N-terminal domain-containing protein [Rhodobium orientis]MBB4301530.1 3-methylcrotonyl-CoA carboxylase alpha subunit [Rhodobium orientis]MBK5952227.1 carbamoyl-phosphate synthase subunit L [Rhodobium orientis]RAI24828.1 carbamoyl-phosphate synthase subunit L [Rhodobium orientis]